MEFIKLLIAIPVLQLFISGLLSFTAFLLKGEKSYYLMAMLQQIIAIFLPAYYFCRIKNNNTYLDKKDIEVENPAVLLYFALLGLSIQLVASAVNMPFALLFSKFGIIPPEAIPVKNLFEFLCSVASICLLPAVFEEVLFRKIIFNKIRQYSKRTAVIFSAILFSMAHMNFYSMAAILFIGIVFGILRVKGYPLIHLMVCHFFVNFAGVIINLLLEYNFFISYYYLLTALSLTAMVFLMKRLLNFQEQLEFNYYKNPELQFLKLLFKSLDIYIYITLFIVIGVINLY